MSIAKSLLSTKNRKAFFEMIEIQLVVEIFRVHGFDFVSLQLN